MGISSLRADSADAELLQLLAQGGVRSVALAPEAGSDRLRRVINKGLTRDDLAKAAVDVSRAGIPQLRLYFMVGLPTETLDDVAEIPRLVKFLEHAVIKASQGKKHLGLITLSLSSFVPKPFTPFQWVPFLEVAELKKRLKLVAREFHGVKSDAGPHRPPQVGLRPGPAGPGGPPGGRYPPGGARAGLEPGP